jgi:hypothetical protein
VDLEDLGVVDLVGVPGMGVFFPEVGVPDRLGGPELEDKVVALGARLN